MNLCLQVASNKGGWYSSNSMVGPSSSKGWTGSPSLLNRVEDVDIGKGAGVATTDRHYRSSLDCLKSKPSPRPRERSHLSPGHQLGIKHLSRGEIPSSPTPSY